MLRQPSLPYTSTYEFHRCIAIDGELVDVEEEAHANSTELTGSKPTPAEKSLAGITHDLPIKTKYYTTTVPIWLDLIESPSEWASSFLSTDASEVLAVLGGLILIFSIPDSNCSTDATRQLIQHVGKVVHDGLGGWSWDGVKLAVGVGAASNVDEWDELCAEAGLEFVQVGGDESKLLLFGGKNHPTLTWN